MPFSEGLLKKMSLICKLDLGGVGEIAFSAFRIHSFFANPELPAAYQEKCTASQRTITSKGLLLNALNVWERKGRRISSLSLSLFLRKAGRS